MKIAYLITRMDELGGAQIHVRDLALWMKSQGHDVAVLSGTLGLTTDFLQNENVRIFEVPSLERAIHPARDKAAFLELKEILVAEKFDILSCHSSKAGLLGRMAARASATPVIFTAHGWAFTPGVPAAKRLVYRFLEKLVGPYSDHIVTVSEFDRQLAIDARIAKPEKITAVHNGMPDRPRVHRQIQDGPVKLMSVARIGPQKDHETLLRACAKLKDLDWTLDLIGGGDDTQLRQLAKDLGLDDRVLFRGERSDIAELMQAQADIYLLISNWEGFPRSILEAMRSGLPVVATNVAGVAEAVEDGVTGYLVRPKDADGLSGILRRIIPDKAALITIGDAARRRFEEDFAFSAMAAKTLAIYRSVDNRNRQGQGN